MSNQIAKTLNMQPLVKEDENKVVAIPSEVDNDFNLARENIIDAINNSKDAIETVADLAQQSQSPRFFEVLATLLKTNIDANEKLVDLQKKLKDIKKSEPSSQPEKTINNNLILTTHELQNLLIEKIKNGN